MWTTDIRKEDINQVICNHTATFGFRILDTDISKPMIFEHDHKRHIIRIENTQDYCIAYRASPGLGTLEVLLETMRFKHLPSQNYCFVLSWQPEELSFALIAGNGDSVSGESRASSRKLNVTVQGIKSSSNDVEVMLVGAAVNGSQITPTALDQWCDVRKACQHLITNREPIDDFLFQTIIYGQSLCMTVTGFEGLLKKRFVELEEEGVMPDEVKIRKKFKYGANSINFQNFDDAKKAYKAAYNIVFGKLVSSNVIEEIKKYIMYRHRLVHQSPILAPLNFEEIQNGVLIPEKHEYANKEMLESVFAVFDQMVSSLNRATLTLERQA